MCIYCKIGLKVLGVTSQIVVYDITRTIGLCMTPPGLVYDIIT